MIVEDTRLHGAFSLTEQQKKFSEHLERNLGIAWKVACSWCKQSVDREDMVQEIVLQLWRAFPKYDSSRPFSTWMYRIALNVAISAGRSRRRKRSAQVEDGFDPIDPTAGTEVEARFRELFQVIDQLAELDRAILLLWFEDHSYAAIGEVLGLTETNVATRLSRLRKKIQANS